MVFYYYPISGTPTLSTTTTTQKPTMGHSEKGDQNTSLVNLHVDHLIDHLSGGALYLMIILMAIGIFYCCKRRGCCTKVPRWDRTWASPNPTLPLTDPTLPVPPVAPMAAQPAPLPPPAPIIQPAITVAQQEPTTIYPALPEPQSVVVLPTTASVMSERFARKGRTSWD